MKKLFNSDWQFKKFPLSTSHEEALAETKLSPVEIPHDWMIFDTNNLYEDSIGLYRKEFNLSPEKDAHYFVRFEGVYMDTTVYCNGEKVCEWKYGYSTFDADITNFVKDGTNTINVIVKYASPNSRWYSGAGIFRNVYFVAKKNVFFTLDGIYLNATQSEKNPSDFLLKIDSEISPAKGLKVSVSHTIYDEYHTEVASLSDSFETGSAVTINSQQVEICSPHRWDLESPHLYTVESKLLVDGVAVDTETNPLGFRTIKFDPDKGFFLNNRSVKINGACQHHDLGALGSAMNKTALRRQFKMLKEMGVNSIRTSHNMPAKEVMELADEMGLLINSEAFDMWELPKTEHDYGNYFPEWYEKDVTSWVRRDRNHPSLIIWSIGNEIYDTHAGTGYKWTILLRDCTRRNDYMHNAYIGIGSNYIEWDNAQKCSNELELSGYNYGERLYEAHHHKYPNWCIFGSETASTVQSRGIYHFPLENRLLTYEDGQCSCLGNCSTNWGAKNVDAVVYNHRDKDYVFGQYIWTGWDYIGEPTPYFSKNSFFGQIDTAGFPKDTFYQYQAEWTSFKDNPMVHILPYWDYNPGQIIDVVVYSNAPMVELVLNGVSKGRKKIDHKHGTELKAVWKVPYEEGYIAAFAYDENKNVVCGKYNYSFEDPAKLRLNSDKYELNANGTDLCFIEIDTVDKSGHTVENARNRVNVSVSGKGRLVGLDNGDSTDYEQYKGSNRKLFSGKLLAIVESTDEPGEITVTATSKDLVSSTITLTSIKADIPEGTSRVYTQNFETPLGNDVPVRKILLSAKGEQTLTKESTTSTVVYEVFPKNATFNDISFRALTKDGVDANFVKLEAMDNSVKVTALGDGEFRLTAFANNGSDHPEVMSELEFSVTGLGVAAFNPYGFVPGCEYSGSNVDGCELSFEGGIFVPSTGASYISFNNVDFGDYGSDEITIPIFIFEDEMPIEVWEGTPDNGECLVKATYQAKTWYNHYQANTFKLSRRLRGTTTVSIACTSQNRYSVKGFSFKKYDKAYSLIPSTEFSRISGDSFTVKETAVEHIGNNVTLEYDNMDFSTKGVSQITITGCSHKEKTSIHLLFIEGDSTTKQMVEVPFSDDYIETTIPIEDIRTNGKFSIVFLPGSDFDLKNFRFS